MEVYESKPKKEKRSTQHIPLIFRPLFTSDRLSTRHEAILLIIVGAILTGFFMLCVVAVSSLYWADFIPDPVTIEGKVWAIESDGCSCASVRYTFEVGTDSGIQIMMGSDTIDNDKQHYSVNDPILITYSASQPTQNIATYRPNPISTALKVLSFLNLLVPLGLYMLLGGLVVARSEHYPQQKRKRGLDI